MYLWRICRKPSLPCWERRMGKKMGWWDGGCGVKRRIYDSIEKNKTLEYKQWVRFVFYFWSSWELSALWMCDIPLLVRVCVYFTISKTTPYKTPFTCENNFPQQHFQINFTQISVHIEKCKTEQEMHLPFTPPWLNKEKKTLKEVTGSYSQTESQLADPPFSQLLLSTFTFTVFYPWLLWYKWFLLCYLITDCTC